VSGRLPIRTDHAGRPIATCSRCAFPFVYIDRRHTAEADGSPICERCLDAALHTVGLHRVNGVRP
jgi:hypothetical protein